jgi:hypothetical protein
MLRDARRQPAAACALVMALCLVACGSSAPGVVGATAYARSFCLAVRPFEADLAQRSQALAQGSKGTPAHQKVALGGFLTGLADDLRVAVNHLGVAGTPKVARGAAVAHSITGAFTRVESELRSAAREMAGLPTGSQPVFTRAADQVLLGVRASVAGIGRSGTRSPALEAAARKVKACQAGG